MNKKTALPNWAPKGTIRQNGWYYYRKYLGMENGKRRYGPKIKIAPTDCTPAQFFKHFDAIEKKEDARTLRWLLDNYNKSPKAKGHAFKSQLDYIAHADSLCSIPIKTRGGQNLVLGNIELDRITRPKIQTIIDRAEKPIGMNRKIQYLRAAWNWAKNRFENMPENPCTGIELNKETARDRCPEDWEYAVVFDCALSMRNPIFAPAMEFAYLMRARRGEVFNLQPNHIMSNGILLERSKGSDSEVTGWSERLHSAVTLAKQIYPSAPRPIKNAYLLHDKKGLKYTKNALDSAWQRVIEKAMEKGAELPEDLIREAKAQGARVAGTTVFLKEKFTFHDIKAKGHTDHTDENASGHRSEKMRAVYQRKPRVREATR